MKMLMKSYYVRFFEKRDIQGVFWTNKTFAVYFQLPTAYSVHSLGSFLCTKKCGIYISPLIFMLCMARPTVGDILLGVQRIVGENHQKSTPSCEVKKSQQTAWKFQQTKIPILLVETHTSIFFSGALGQKSWVVWVLRCSIIYTHLYSGPCSKNNNYEQLPWIMKIPLEICFFTCNCVHIHL